MAGRTLIPDPDDYKELSAEDLARLERRSQRLARETTEREIANTPGGIDPIPQPPMMAGDSGGPGGQLMRLILTGAPSRTTGEFGLDAAPSAAPRPLMAGDSSGPGGQLLKTILAAQGKAAPAPQGFDWDAHPDAPAQGGSAAAAFDWDAHPDAPAPGAPVQTFAPSAPEKRDAPGWGSTFVRYAGHVPGVDQVAGAIGAIENQDTLHRSMPFLIPFDKDARDAAVHDYRFIRDRSREDRETGGDAHPTAKWSGIAGQTALSLLAPVPKGTGLGGELAQIAPKLSLGQRLLQAAKAGAAYGGAGGLLDGDADLTKGELGKAALQTGVGAASGALVGGGLQAGAEGASALLADPLRRVAAKLAYRATDGKLRDVKLLGPNAGERVEQVGNQLLDDGAIPTNPLKATPENIAARVHGLREAGGAEKGASVDAMDVARPVAPVRLNRLGADIPASSSVVAGLEVPRPGPQPIDLLGGTTTAPPAQNVEILPASSPALRAAPSAKSPSTLLSRKAVADALEKEADGMAPLAGKSGVADTLRKEAAKIRENGSDRMTFKEAEALKSSYGKAFNTLGQNDSNAARQMVYEHIKQRVEDEARATVPPEVFDRFMKAKERFANLKPAENAATSAEQRAIANQLGGILHVAGAGGAIAGVMTGHPLEGLAALATPMVYKAIQRRAPGASAVLLRGASNALRAAPELGARLPLPALAAEHELAPALQLPPGLLPSFANESEEEARDRAMLAALRRQ